MPPSDSGLPPKRPATIKTIAKALGLSPSTVSRALRSDGLAHPNTRKLVNEAAEAMGYRRDFRGVNLRTGKTFTLCAILASQPSQEFGDPATMHLIQGLIGGVQNTDFKMVIQPVDGTEPLFAALREAVEDGRFDGFILDHTEPQDRRVRYLLEQDVPFVTFGRTELFTEHPFFDIDNEYAAHSATQHLIACGHKRIALIDAPSNYLFTAQRRRGYQRALAEADIAYDPALLLETSISPSHVDVEVSRLLNLKNPPTGFVTSNEVATIGAVTACRRVAPKALAGIQFASRDGTKFFDYYQPAISSAYYPMLKAGINLAGMLVKAVQGAPISSLQTIEQTELIVRE